MADMVWRRQRQVAASLQDILGEDFRIEHDSGDSGITRCYFRGVPCKEVPDTSMTGDLNVSDFRCDWLQRAELGIR